MYNPEQDCSHFIDEGTQEGGAGTACPRALFRLRHVKPKGSLSRYHVPRLCRALQSPSNILAGGEGGADGADRAKYSFPQNFRAARSKTSLAASVTMREMNVIQGGARVFA